MTLTRDEIGEIADDAVNLKAALVARKFGENAARDAVIAAMPALVAVSTEAPKLIELVHADPGDRTLGDAGTGPPPDLPDWIPATDPSIPDKSGPLA